MKYKVKIKYWSGWLKDYTTLENIIIAKDYVEAIRLGLLQFDEDDIDEIDVEAVYD